MRPGPAYLALQGAGGLAWWIGMFSSERIRSWFVPNGWETAQTLVIADVVLFGFGSLMTALLLHRGSPWASPASWALLGVVAYATLTAVGWLSAPIAHWLGLLFMIPSLLLTAAVVFHHHQNATTSQVP